MEDLKKEIFVIVGRLNIGMLTFLRVCGELKECLDKYAAKIESRVAELEKGNEILKKQLAAANESLDVRKW
jgi:hypothetical protein